MATLGTLPPRVGIGCCSCALPSGNETAGLAHGEDVAELVDVAGGLGDVLCLDDGTVVSLVESSLEWVVGGAAAATGRTCLVSGLLRQA